MQPEIRYIDWCQVQTSEIHCCPGCKSDLMQIQDFQALPGGRRWTLETFCPECESGWQGQVDIHRICQIIERTEQASIQMMLAAHRLDSEKTNP